VTRSPVAGPSSDANPLAVNAGAESAERAGPVIEPLIVAPLTTVVFEEPDISLGADGAPQPAAPKPAASDMRTITFLKFTDSLPLSSSAGEV